MLLVRAPFCRPRANSVCFTTYCPTIARPCHRTTAHCREFHMPLAGRKGTDPFGSQGQMQNKNHLLDSIANWN